MNWLINSELGIVSLIGWSAAGLGACVICMAEPYPYYSDFSRLQRIFFHLVTGPAGWLTGIWKLLSLY